MPGLSEESLDRKRVVIRLPIKIHKQVLRKFAQDGDAGASTAVSRALETLVKGMHLTTADKAFVTATRQQNLDRRMANRKKHKEKMLAASADAKAKASAAVSNKKGGVK